MPPYQKDLPSYVIVDRHDAGGVKIVVKPIALRGGRVGAAVVEGAKVEEVEMETVSDMADCPESLAVIVQPAEKSLLLVAIADQERLHPDHLAPS